MAWGFNPCCRGSRSTARGPRIANPYKDRFQSLLSWISVNCPSRPCNSRSPPRCFNPCCRGSRSTARTTTISRPALLCFNPCCRGSRSTAPVKLLLPGPLLGFQSLLSWISVNCPCPICLTRGGNPVSILVVVDLGQLHLEPLRPKLEQILFQSLLSWISVNCQHRGGSAHLRQRFQSLLSWISVNCGGHRPRSRQGEAVSILVVVDLGQLRAADGRLRPQRAVSILVVVDLGQLPERRHNECTRQRGFQSLLSWISVNCTSVGVSGPLPMSGFNPCCRGSRSTAALEVLGSAQLDRFQSLLSWISVNCIDIFHHKERPVWVSILVVVDLGQLHVCGVRAFFAVSVSILVVVDLGQLHGPEAIERWNGMGFQSLLSWISVNCLPVPPSTSPTLHGVSILVVVDLGQLRSRGGGCAGHRHRFQSLLSWISVNCRGDHRSSSSGRLVSILVVVDLGQLPTN